MDVFNKSNIIIHESNRLYFYLYFIYCVLLKKIKQLPYIYFENEWYSNTVLIVKMNL